MKDSKPVVVGIGELLWDVLPTGKRAGGAPINFVYHATQLGAEGYAISAVGNDVFGTEIVQELDKNGICHLLGTVEYPTGQGYRAGCHLSHFRFPGYGQNLWSGTEPLHRNRFQPL